MFDGWFSKIKVYISEIECKDNFITVVVYR